MSKRKNILPFAPLGVLIQEASGKRVTKDAKITSSEILENLTERIIKKAVLLADHSGRKTVKAKDISLAFNQLKGDL